MKTQPFTSMKNRTVSFSTVILGRESATCGSRAAYSSLAPVVALWI